MSSLSSLFFPQQITGTTSQNASLGNIFNAINKYSPNADHSVKSQKDLALIAEKAMKDGATNAGQFLATFALDSAAYARLAGLDGGTDASVSAVDFAKLAQSGGDQTQINPADFTASQITSPAKSFNTDDLDRAAGNNPTTGNNDSTTQLLLQLLLLLLGSGGAGYPAQQTQQSNPLIALLSGLFSNTGN